MQTDLAPALARFGFDLHRELAAAEDGNLVSSPYSVAAVLAMASAGARGETAEQLRAVLGGDRLAGLAALEASLAGRTGEADFRTGEPAEVRVATANRLWAQGGLRWAEDFLQTLESQFGASLAMADFNADPEDARREINTWVAERTREQITDLLAPGTVAESTRLVLVNAIHLKTPWRQPFEPAATRRLPFHRLDGTTAEAMFMHGVGQGYASGPGWAATELPAQGGLSLLVVLPDPDRFAEVEAGLDEGWLAGLQFSHPAVELRLPRWTTRSAADLTPALRGLGLPLVFSQAADFSGMTASEPIRASAVVQQAFVAVAEHGVEAAAATAMLAAPGGMPAEREQVTFTADRPFLYLVRDTATGTPLFIGRVLEPTVHESDA